MDNQKLTAKKDPISKKYETPYCLVTISRQCYQSSAGGLLVEKSDLLIGTAGFAPVRDFAPNP